MSEETTMSDSEKKKEDWMNSKWRPMMGWMYMMVCTSDFVLFPILWSLVQVVGGGRVETQWSPITLQGAGLFHMAMGAILGIAAYGRTQEKLGDKAGSTIPSSPSPAPSFTPSQPVSAPRPVVTAAPVATAPAPSFTPSFAPAQPVAVSSTGKPMPVPADEPEL